MESFFLWMPIFPVGAVGSRRVLSYAGSLLGVGGDTLLPSHPTNGLALGWVTPLGGTGGRMSS